VNEDAINQSNKQSYEGIAKTIKELRQELERHNARGYSRKSKVELIKQLTEM
jgi:hypothetical protein